MELCKIILSMQKVYLLENQLLKNLKIMVVKILLRQQNLIVKFIMVHMFIILKIFIRFLKKNNISKKLKNYEELSKNLTQDLKK